MLTLKCGLITSFTIYLHFQHLDFNLLYLQLGQVRNRLQLITGKVFET